MKRSARILALLLALVLLLGMLLLLTAALAVRRTGLKRKK